MMERSDFAPASWRMDQTEAAIRTTVLRLDPDFVFFQELPGLVPYIESYDMVPANARGQSGDIATLARAKLMPDIEAGTEEHAVLAHIRSADLTIANVHLTSGRAGDKTRARQIRYIKSASRAALAIIGDTNTRTAEEEQIARYGLKGARPPEPTWNGRIGRFRRDARAYTAYFTRVFHTTQVTLWDQKVHNAPLEADGEKFHLSDHFALSGRIEVDTKEKAE